LRAKSADLLATFWRHCNQAALTADPATPTAHFSHDDGNGTATDAGGFLNGRQGFIEYPAGALNDINSFCTFALWHDSSVARGAARRQEVGISN